MARLLPSDRRLRLFAAAGYAALALVITVLLAVALFPVGLFMGLVERVLFERFGRGVTIGAIERTDVFSLTPRIVVRDLRVPQPAWAGAGDLARVREAELTLATGPLLRGRIAPTAIRLVGARLVLVRDKAGRENWHGDDQRDRPSRNTPVIRRLEIADSTLTYRDARQNRQFALRLLANPQVGLVARGSGTVRGEAVRVAVKGGAIGAATAPWPFAATIDGAALAMTARGTMASPLDTDRMSLDVTARAMELKLIDAIIEAGLFEAQPLRLSAHVERTAPAWRVTRLTGTIGRSRLSGHVDVTKANGRTRIDGAIDSPGFDPSDLASDEGLAEAAGLKRAGGPKLVPNTRVDISKIALTGRLDARAYLVGRGETIRAAVGAADGRIGVVARDGALPERIADAIGFDAGRALFAGSDDRAGLRCVVFAAALRGGRGRVAPLIVDTVQSRLDGSGTIAFPTEALALKLTGAPKRGSVLRLSGAAYLTGTLMEPRLVIPREVKSAGNIVEAIGRAITGRQGPVAQDADCTGLPARVLC